MLDVLSATTDRRKIMSRYDADNDAFEWINGKKVLKDGARARVPLTMQDAMTPLQREIATERAQLTDSMGNRDEFTFSRPGYRIIADAAARDALAAARQEYLDYITNAWRTKPPRV